MDPSQTLQSCKVAWASASTRSGPGVKGLCCACSLEGKSRLKQLSVRYELSVPLASFYDLVLS